MWLANEVETKEKDTTNEAWGAGIKKQLGFWPNLVSVDRGILLFIQTDLLISKWNDQNVFTWLKSR